MIENRNHEEMSNEEMSNEEMNNLSEAMNESNGLNGDVAESAVAAESMEGWSDAASSAKQLKMTETVRVGRRKEKGGRKNILQLVLVALLSSMVGGSSVLAAFTLAPAAFGNTNPSNTASVSTALKTTAVTSYKTVSTTQSETTVTAVADKVSPSVVGIKVTVAASQNDFFFGASQGSGGEGSGIIISQDGYILTNNHVVEEALTSGTNTLSNGAKIEVILPNQMDKSYEATVIGRDSQSDLAVIKINAAGLPAAELGNSDTLKVGELAVAIGNPGGLDYMGSVTAGVISGLNRTLESSDGKELHLIQTDAAINPGNSGGALCNAEGQVIGINSVKIAATGYEGLGFAIPINSAKEIAQDLINYQYVKGRPLLGVSIDQRFNAQVASANSVPNGLLVADVSAGGPAEAAGIKSGDILTKFDGKTVTDFSTLSTLRDAHKPGDNVAVEIYRDGKTLKMTVTLGEKKI